MIFDIIIEKQEVNMKKMIKKDPYDYVDPTIDTGKPKPRWVFFQSASLPFGMVQLSPDTDINGTWGVGYRYHSKRIRCFSHIHQWQLSGIAVLPGNENVPFQNGYRFSHASEIVQPGYHCLYLKECGIRAELSASLRTGIHRYTFNEKKGKFILLDLKRQLGPSEMASYEVTLLNNHSLHGYAENAPTIRRPKPCKIFFHLECDEAFSMIEKEGLNFLVFKDDSANVITLKIAVSFVSSENAKLNMENEISHFDFEKVRINAKSSWVEYLSRVSVKSGNEKHLIKFYTDLWRTSMGGHVISDVNHEYTDMTGDNPVTRMSDGYDFISNADIFWGAHWSLSLVYDLIYPRIKSDYCSSLIQFSKNGGYVPRGPSGGNYTHVMIGAHSGSFIASAFYKGIRDFDMEAAYRGIKANAFKGGLMSKSGYEHNSCLDGGIDEYMEKGYIPAREPKSKGYHCDSASQTVEYSYDDWVLSNLADSLDKKEDHDYFLKRSQHCLNLFDEKTKFIRPKDNNGNFIEPFDPRSKSEFCEGNSWSYTYYVPHDIKSIINLTGGEHEFNKKLNYAFNKSRFKKYYARKPATRRDKVYINYGNENMRFTASLFNYSNAPYLAQKWSRKVKEALFSGIGKNGFREDDDCGLSAGTSLLLGLGLFDFKGGAYENPEYEITSPIFDEIVIKLDEKYYSGNTVTIRTYNNSKKNVYIEKILFNGIEIKNYRIKHHELIKGGLLEIFLTKKQPG